MSSVREISGQHSSAWSVQKYARFIGEPESLGSNAQPHDTWKFYDNSGGQIEMLLTTSHHMVITQGKHILENVSLWNASSWMKAVSKGDSMLIMYKMKEKNHKFRVKFAGKSPEDCIETCSSCIFRLAKFFPIKRMNMLGQEEGAGDKRQLDAAGDKGDEMMGDVTVGKLAEVLSKGGVGGFPAAYREASLSLPPDQIATMLKLCLTDANFPAFVGQVERELEKLKK